MSGDRSHPFSQTRAVGPEWQTGTNADAQPYADESLSWIKIHVTDNRQP